MLTEDFHYNYPEHLVAAQPQKDFRILWSGGAEKAPREITKAELFSEFTPGDVLTINDTRVLRRRVTAPNGLEILFIKKVGTTSDEIWEVLCPARVLKDGEEFALPGDITAKLVARGLPQKLRISKLLDENYFSAHGELAIPPYIQKARGERFNRPEEEKWYQTEWAKNAGSQAAPTASLHFSKQDLAFLIGNGIRVTSLTLHVGMGTFLPIKTPHIEQHQMHSESVNIPASSVRAIIEAKVKGQKVWALGTTVARALESWGHGLLHENEKGDFIGESALFIYPGFRFEVVGGLLTNFHQPSSTLLALISAFANREQVLSAYEWAIAQKFRLFSYGDLTAWKR